MQIKIEDSKGNQIFQMAFVYEIDEDFVPSLIKFIKKHKIINKEKTK